MRYKIPAITLFVSLLSAMGCAAQPPAVPPPPPPPGPSAFAPLPPPPRGRGGPGPLSPGPRERGLQATVTGVVQRFNYGPGGLDGLVLDQGTIVHFPLEYSSQVSAAAPVGSAVAVSGWSHIGPAGDTLFEADTITNQRSRTSIVMAAGAPPPPPGHPLGPTGFTGPQPPPPPPPASAEYGPPSPPGPDSYPMAVAPAAASTVLSGVVRSFNYGIDGQVNGFVLSDQTPVYFPPEFAEQVTRAVAVGASVKVMGSPRAGPTGNRLIDAQVITNQKTGVSATVQ